MAILHRTFSNQFFFPVKPVFVTCSWLVSTWTKTRWTGQGVPSALLSMITGGRQVGCFFRYTYSTFPMNLAGKTHGKNHVPCRDHDDTVPEHFHWRGDIARSDWFKVCRQFCTVTVPWRYVSEQFHWINSDIARSDWFKGCRQFRTVLCVVIYVIYIVVLST